MVFDGTKFKLWYPAIIGDSLGIASEGETICQRPVAARNCSSLEDNDNLRKLPSALVAGVSSKKLSKSQLVQVSFLAHTRVDLT